MRTRLYRSSTDKVIGGVAGGLAVWMNVDPSLVRIAWVLLAILSGGIFVLVYFVMMLVVPLAPVGWTPNQDAPFGTPGEGAIPGWDPGTGTWGATGSSPGVAPGGVPPTGGSGSPAWPTGSAPGPAPQPGWQPPPAGDGWNRANAGNAGIVIGAVLVLLGVWFLVDEYLHIDWSLLWPVVVVVLGVVLIVGAMRRGRPAG